MEVVSRQLDAEGVPASLEDAAVARCQRGDTAAFRSIYDLHGIRLYRLALLIGGDEVFAKDAVQETFIRAWKRIRQFRVGSDLRAWLTTILLNQIRSSIRQRVRRSSVIRQVALDQAADIESMDSAASLDPFERQDLMSAFSGLNADQRIVVALRFYWGLTIPEIARQVGTSEGTVKSRLHRAISGMRAYMNDVSRGFLPGATIDREMHR